MTAPSRKAHDPTAFTLGWEAAVGVIGLVVAVLALAAVTGVGIAAWAFGGGWVWPHGLDTIGHTLAGLATGHPGRGLRPPDAARAAGPALTYLCAAGCETAAIAGGLVAGLAIARRLRNDGMATRHDAEQALGLSALRAAKPIIRPDLYGHDADAPATLDHAPTLIGWTRRQTR